MWGTIPYGQRSQEHAERQQRSVFIGNIPYTATEDELKEIFQRAGPIVAFKYVMDRETGKPKGYAFCEYGDVAIAESAIRNLNNFEMGGRPLRVDSAANQGPRPGPQQQQPAAPQLTPADESLLQAASQAAVQQTAEAPYGESVETEKAPEAISQAVASLPPEQMFELMKQMKLCIQNNPNEARNMLLQNPQLAYALLQAQVVMRILDPQVAMTMLHRDANAVPPLAPGPSSVRPAVGGGAQATVAPPTQAAGISTEEREKAELIRQVMELTEEQIAMLPPDHRNSVMLLRQSLRAHGHI